MQLRQNLHARAQERLFLRPLEHANAIGPLNDHVQRVFDSLHALDHYERADFEEVFRFGVFLGSFVGPHADASEQFFFAGERGFDRGHRGGTSGGQRHHRFRKQRGVLQREYRDFERLRAQFLRRVSQ